MSLLAHLTGAHERVLRPSGGCHNCPRRRVDFVPATMPVGAQVLWLGEAPGQTEAETREGFTGKSGQTLRTAATAAGVPLPWAFSHTIHCRPPENATPSDKEIQCCLSQFVLDEVRQYPWVVLAGGVPLMALFPGASGAKFRGNVAYHPDFPGTRFFAMYHPSYVLRRPSVASEYRQHMERLAALVRGERKIDWRLLRTTTPDFWSELDRALAAPLISADIETTQLESWLPGAKIKSLALTVDAQAVLYVEDTDPQFRAVLRRVQVFAEDPSKHIVGANIGFDLVYLEEDGNYRHQCQLHDVSTLYYEMGKYKQPSLKELAAKEGDGYLFLLHHTFHMPDIAPWYNSEDVVQALRLYRKGMAIASPATRDLVLQTTAPAGYVLRRITQHGLYVREDYRQQKIAEYKAKRVEAVAAWCAEDRAFIPTVHESGRGLMEYLFKLKKLPDDRRAEKGEPATDRMAIKLWIQAGAVYLRHLLQIREIDKLLSTYFEAYDDHIGTDSRIHSSYTSTYTDTGRPSSREPNLMNIPKPAEVRDLFGAPRGSLMGESDLNQIEFRIMVSLARDENGIAGYMRGDDAHLMTARSFAPVPTKEDRSKAKPVNFALLYKGSWRNVQKIAFEWYGQDWPESQCRDFEQAFLRTYPRIPVFHQYSQDKLIRNHGWFESVTGHCYQYTGWDAEDSGTREHVFRSALNSEAQGPAAHICYRIMTEAHRLFVRRKVPVAFVNTVYDSILWELGDPKRLPDVLEGLEEARALTYEWVKPWFLVPLLIEHNVGESWGSLKELKVT